MVKNPLTMQEMYVEMWILGQEDPLEEDMATHSSNLDQRKKTHGQRGLEGYSPWGCKRLGHD